MYHNALFLHGIGRYDGALFDQPETSMTLHLPAAIAAYFDAANAGDPARVALCFTGDALVRDEGRDLRGRAAIADWAEHSHNQYVALATPLEIHAAGAHQLVVAQVAGTFPGSPLPLRFQFGLADGLADGMAGSLIASLEVTP